MVTTPASGRATRIWPAGSAAVNSVERRQENYGSGEFFQVVSVRVYELSDGREAAGPPIAIELRGRVIRGQLIKGDVIALPRRRSGRVLEVERLHNLRTNSWLVAEGRPYLGVRAAMRRVRLVLSILGVLLFLVFLAFFVFLAAQVLPKVLHS